MPAHFLVTLPNFLAYLGTAIALLAVFVTIYLYVTPYDEIALIRNNNTAAADPYDDGDNAGSGGNMFD